MPYYLGGEIADRSKLLLQTPASLSATLGLTVQANTTVTAINRAAKTITVQPTVPAAASASSSASPVEVPYDKLLISTGAAPFRPPIPGINLAHVMRSMADIDAIKSETDALLAAAAGSGGRKPRAVVLGAGFIGIEAAEQLTRRGFQVTVVEARGHILPAMDAEMVTSLTTDMRQQGVQVLTSSTAAGIVSAGGRHKLEVHLSSGLCLPADLVLLSAGVRPESGLAAAAGLTLDPHTSAIAVNAHMQTSDPHIYAVGDVIAAPSLVYPDVLTWTPLGGPANRQGRLASEHMVKGAAADKYRGSLGTAIVRGFDTTVGVTGMTEARLQQLGKRYETVVVSGTNHASYYPRSEPITLKGLYDPGTRRLLGAQAFGGSEGVDKRLDVLATTIAAHGTIDDLAHLELSYAPPFGSARDVVNTLGFAAQNIAAGVLIPERKLSALPRGRVLLDVRDATSASLKPYNALVPAGTPIVAIPASELRKPEVLAQLDKGAAYTTACAVGKMSYFSARILAQSGFTNVTSLIGGHALAAPPAPNAADADGAYTKPAAATAAATAAASTATAAAPSAAAAGSGQVVEVDACGLACPGPIMKIRTNLPALQPGGVLKVKASDPGFYSDVRAFAAAAGVDLVSVSRDRGVITAVLKRPEAPLDSLMSGTITATTHEHDAAAHAAAQAHAQSVPPTAAATGKAATAAAAAGGNAHDVAIVCFSGEMDKVLAALVIANGAIAMGVSAHTALSCVVFNVPLLRCHTFL